MCKHASVRATVGSRCRLGTIHVRLRDCSNLAVQIKAVRKLLAKPGTQIRVHAVNPFLQTAAQLLKLFLRGFSSSNDFSKHPELVEELG
jgi:hypothetical protein